MARVVIADDHAVVRKGLRQMLAEAGEHIVVGEAGSSGELLTLLRSRPVDVVVLDLALGEHDGLALIKQVKSEFPRLPILVLSMHREEVYAPHALRAGASGYVQKAGPPEMLLDAIRQIAAGRTYVSPAMAQRLTAGMAHGGNDSLPHERLSDREFEVFRLLGGGKSVTEIAHGLNLSVKTVSTHRTHILSKMGFHTNAEIVEYVAAHGLR
jgi:two-component system, NarL family, invasion response regulator UvrY